MRIIGEFVISSLSLRDSYVREEQKISKNNKITSEISHCSYRKAKDINKVHTQIVAQIHLTHTFYERSRYTKRRQHQDKAFKFE